MSRDDGSDPFGILGFMRELSNGLAYTNSKNKKNKTSGDYEYQKNLERNFAKKKNHARLERLASRAGTDYIYAYKIGIFGDFGDEWDGEIPADSVKDAKDRLMEMHGVPRADIRTRRIHIR